jgi:hypothetical protein
MKNLRFSKKSIIFCYAMVTIFGIVNMIAGINGKPWATDVFTEWWIAFWGINAICLTVMKIFERKENAKKLQKALDCTVDEIKNFAEGLDDDDIKNGISKIVDKVL